MQYYVTTTIGGTAIKSKTFSTIVEAQKAQKELSRIAQENGFDLTYKIVIDGLFCHYQTALTQICESSKKSLVLDIEGDFHAGNLTAAEYKKLMNMLEEG